MHSPQTHEAFYVAMFKQDRKINTDVAFVLIDNDLKVQALSSSCIRMLHLDANKLRRLNENNK